MRFSCPACQTPFEVNDASLAPREAVELDCPGCRRALLLEPSVTGHWGITPVAQPVEERPLDDLPAEELPSSAGQTVQLPPRAGKTESGFFRDLGQVKLDLPAPGPRKAPPPSHNLWQEMSVMFRMDQAQKGRKSLYAWGAVLLLLLGGIGALLGMKLSRDEAQDELKAMREGLATFTLPYQTGDADKTAPGTVLSRKLSIIGQLARQNSRAEALPLPEPVTPDVAAMALPRGPTAVTGGALDLKAQLDKTCQDHAGAIAACARKFMVPRPLRVRFIVNVKGRPESVRVSGGGDRHDAFQGCVARGLRDVDLGPQVLELRYTCAVP